MALRFGDFAGFYLLTEHGHERAYRSREAEIESLVRYAWNDRVVITVVSEARSGAVLTRNNPDEYMVLLPPPTEAAIEAGGARIDAGGDSLVIVPPGESRLTVRKAGTFIRVFSSKAADLAAAAIGPLIEREVLAAVELKPGIVDVAETRLAQGGG